jgi:uncharacterized protein
MTRKGEEMETFVVLSAAGAARDLSKGSREQAWWDDHAAFIDALVEDDFIMLGGPFTEEGGAMLVVQAESDAAVRARLTDDPWYRHDILRLERVVRWQIFVDQR